MIQKQSLIDLLPKQYHLPLRFHYWKIRGKHEREIFLLKELVSSRKRAIDIGANVGTYSYALSKLYKVVEVFEPQSWCAETILAYSQSRKSNINVYNVGLSESKGSLNLHIPIKSGRYLYYLASTYGRKFVYHYEQGTRLLSSWFCIRDSMEVNASCQL